MTWKMNIIQKRVIDIYEKDNTDILLGEIIFDNFDENLKEKYLKPYESDYIELAKIINKQYKDDKKDASFSILEVPLRYSLFTTLNCNYKLPPKVKEFYFGNVKSEQSLYKADTNKNLNK